MDLRRYIRDVPDFPKEGILFRDVTPLLGDPPAFRYSIDQLCVHAARRDASGIVGIEARGFLFGAAMAARMELPFVPLRKAGKLPAARFALEYGNGQLDIHEDALSVGKRTYMVDDLMATGGTAAAATKLVELAGGDVVRLGFVIELEELGGRAKLEGYDTMSIIRY